MSQHDRMRHKSVNSTDHVQNMCKVNKVNVNFATIQACKTIYVIINLIRVIPELRSCHCKFDFIIYPAGSFDVDSTLKFRHRKSVEN